MIYSVGSNPHFKKKKKKDGPFKKYFEASNIDTSSVFVYSGVQETEKLDPSQDD